MKIIVGLGNPEQKYLETRHNVGFKVIDILSSGKSSHKNRFDARIFSAGEFLLVQPQIGMNLSGQSVRQIVNFYNLPLSDLLVMCDDINLPLGRLRVRAKGGHGGHNGLRNIQQHFGNEEYPRLRIGIDLPKYDLLDHVLGKFQADERPVVENAIHKAAEAVLIWVNEGVEVCMNKTN